MGLCSGRTFFEIDNQHSSRWNRKRWIAFGAVLILLVLVAVIGVYLLGNAVSNNSSAEHRNLRNHSWFDAVCSTETSCPSGYARSPLILLSMDGFAARYLRRNMTPSLERLEQCGSRAPFMSPVFPTKTFVNHYSIVTGLYPSAHGIVGNTIYDPVFNKTFSISSPEANNKSWWGGEPIWVTAKRQGLKTASYYWPGSDIIGGENPDYFKTYKRNTPFKVRVDQVLQWLDLPANERPDFIALYFEEPDLTGHRFGPDSVQTDAALIVVDNIVDDLMQGLHARHLLGCINLILLSDHGMSEISCNRIVYLNQMVPNFTTDDMFVLEGTIGRLRPLNPSAASQSEIVRLKDAFQCTSPHVWVYDEEDFPLRWEFRDNRRIDPLIFDVDHEWLINTDNKNPRKHCTGGDHGYDINDEMLTIFIASGPAFKMNYTAQPFLNIQVYNLLSEILGVEPALNNGTDGALSEIVRTKLPHKYVPEVDRGNYICSSPTVSSIWQTGCSSTDSSRLENFTAAGETDLVQGVSLGLPQNEIDRNQSCILPNKDFVTGFSRATKSPLWSMFTIEGNKAADKDYMKNVASQMEWFNDPRLSGFENNQICSRYKTDSLRNESILRVSLLPAFLDDVDLITNAVPMYDGFYSGVWKLFWSKCLSWASTFQAVNAIVGPVWLPRNSSSEIPNYYFVILTYPVRSDRATESLETMGFIIPHLKSIPHCWDVDRYLRKHQSSIDVIEEKTGLKFFTDLPLMESLRLRLKLVHPVSPSPLFQG